MQVNLSLAQMHGVRFCGPSLTKSTSTLPGFELQLVRLGVVREDASPSIKIHRLEKVPTSEPPSDAIIGEQTIIVENREQQAALRGRQKISKDGIRVVGPCIVTEMDSNALILPGHCGEIGSIGNIFIRPLDIKLAISTQNSMDVPATELVRCTPLIPTLVSAALSSIRSEMDKMMLRCSIVSSHPGAAG